MSPAELSTAQRPTWIAAAIALLAFCWLLPPLANADQHTAGPDEPITPIPVSIELPAAKVALGEQLFNDRKLAGKDDLPCAGCHVLEAGGDDGRRIADDPSNGKMPLNTPRPCSMLPTTVVSVGSAGTHHCVRKRPQTLPSAPTTRNPGQR